MSDVDVNNESVIGEQNDQPESVQAPEQPESNRPDGEKAEAGGKEKAPVEKPEKKAVPESVKKGKEQGWIQARLSHYASEARTMKEELRRTREELERLRTPQAGARQDPNRPPSPDDFSKHEEYVDALVDWKIAQREKSQQALQEQKGYTQAYAQRRMQLDQHAQKFAMQYDDPQAVLNVMFNEENPINEVMGEAIMDLGEKAPEVLFYLAQNPMDAMQISTMHPRMAVMQIGLLSQRLSGGAMQPQVSNGTPQTPPPQPKPVPQIRGGSADLSDTKPSDKDPPLTWAQKEAARVRAKFGQNVRMYVPRG